MEQKEILFDIFGRQIGKTWEQGIITHIIKIVSKFSSYVYSFVVYFERFMNLTPRAVSGLEINEFDAKSSACIIILNKRE